VDYEAVIGLEVHAELQTLSKMFCGCPVVDPTRAQPNTAVCPVCLGLPGVLPVINQKAVEFGIKVALALNCQVELTSLFARKNYFYPDLPKGYQISQYEYPLAQNGLLPISTSSGEKRIRIRRVHLEEDTGKLTHITRDGESYSLVDLNRAGIALLEIVSEPDMHSVEEVRAYSQELRSLLRALGVNSGDMEKGVIRFEANVSVRPTGSESMGTRVEIKNLNSFRALERSVAYQIEEQTALLVKGGSVQLQTLGWDENTQATFAQSSKEEAQDYRYFPEPDLPPLRVDQEWIESVRASLPELPYRRTTRMAVSYGLEAETAKLLVEEQAVADYFEEVLANHPDLPPRLAANWITGELFAWMNQRSIPIGQIKVAAHALGTLLEHIQRGSINSGTAKSILVEMLTDGKDASTIIVERGLQQVSDVETIAELVETTLKTHRVELQNYIDGKEALFNWFFGQVMGSVGGKANPTLVRTELEHQLKNARKQPE
jgi:aspartyl-tRNA(Asn)/glutamyl-tRNA(Gln) amidotransferase subunit B